MLFLFVYKLFVHLLILYHVHDVIQLIFVPYIFPYTLFQYIFCFPIKFNPSIKERERERNTCWQILVDKTPTYIYSSSNWVLEQILSAIAGLTLMIFRMTGFLWKLFKKFHQNNFQKWFKWNFVKYECSLSIKMQ